MTQPPKTISNLGTQASVEYASRQRLVDPTFVQDSRTIPHKVEIVPITPYVQNDFDALFSTQPKIQWAVFDPPPSAAASPTVFTFQIAPSMGDPTTQDDMLENLEALQVEPEDQEAKNRFIALYSKFGQLDAQSALIFGCRGRFQKG